MRVEADTMILVLFGAIHPLLGKDQKFCAPAASPRKMPGRYTHSGHAQWVVAHQQPPKHSKSGSSIFSPSWVSQTISSSALYRPFNGVPPSGFGCEAHTMRQLFRKDSFSSKNLIGIV